MKNSSFGFSFKIHNIIHLSSLFLPLKHSSCSEGFFSPWKRSAKAEEGSLAGFQRGGGGCVHRTAFSQPAAAICDANKSRLKSPSGIPLSAAKLSIRSGNSLVKYKMCLCWISCPFLKGLLKQHLHPLFPAPLKYYSMLLFTACVNQANSFLSRWLCCIRSHILHL